MKDFLAKNKNNIIMAVNVMIIILGVVTKDVIFIVIGILLIALNLYVIFSEKKANERKAQLKAEKKAKLQGSKSKNKKKKKSKKRK